MTPERPPPALGSNADDLKSDGGSCGEAQCSILTKAADGGGANVEMLYHLESVRHPQRTACATDVVSIRSASPRLLAAGMNTTHGLHTKCAHDREGTHSDNDGIMRHPTY